jgi:hypothetical protein
MRIFRLVETHDEDEMDERLFVTQTEYTIGRICSFIVMAGFVYVILKAVF